jgi:hypothetical protein
VIDNNSGCFSSFLIIISLLPKLYIVILNITVFKMRVNLTAKNLLLKQAGKNLGSARGKFLPVCSTP